MTAQKFMSEHIDKMGHSMAHFIGSTQPDMLTWSQNDTRTVLEVVGECVTANRLFASLLRGESPEKPTMAVFEDAGTAQAEIIASSRELADAVANVDDGVFERMYHHPVRGPIIGMFLMMGAYRNMAYHGGQINFIQTLGGDHEFHMPPTWLKSD